jgi:hypothetical protein
MPPVPDLIDTMPGNRHAFGHLRALLASGQAIAFVGVGASAGLDPTWQGLIGRLIEETEKRAARRARGAKRLLTPYSHESGLGSRLGLDPTDKWPPETKREWGRRIRMDQEIVERVTQKWPSLGLPGSGRPIRR